MPPLTETLDLSAVELLLTDVRDLLRHSANIRDGLQTPEKLARALGLAQVPAYPYSLEVAFSTIPRGWWWHVSHLECSMVPTSHDPTLPFSNGRIYRKDGSPVQFTESSWGDDRENLAHVILCARLRAKQASLRQRRAVLLRRYEFINTGNGPMIAHPTGEVTEIPPDRYLLPDNELAVRTKEDNGAVHAVYVFGDLT